MQPVTDCNADRDAARFYHEVCQQRQQLLVVLVVLVVVVVLLLLLLLTLAALRSRCCRTADHARPWR